MGGFTQRRLLMSGNLLFILEASSSGNRILRLLEGPTYFRVLVVNATSNCTSRWHLKLRDLLTQFVPYLSIVAPDGS